MPYDSVIEDAARANGLDPALMRRISKIESGGDPYNRTGSYKGLFQLSDDEFGKYGGGNNIYDPVANSNAAARKLAAETEAFKQKYGRDPSATDIYLTHQQGEGGYANHLANPDAPAWENMVATGEGRQKGDRWAKQAIWGNIPDDVKRLFPGGVSTVTSKDFMDIWDRKVNGGSFDGVGRDASPMASAFAAEGNRNMNPIEAALAQARARMQGLQPQDGMLAQQPNDQGVLSQALSQFAPGAADFLPSKDTANNLSTAFSFLRDNPDAIAPTVVANNSNVHTIAHGDNLIQIDKRTGKVLGMTPIPQGPVKPRIIEVDDGTGSGGKVPRLWDGVRMTPIEGAPDQSSKPKPGEKKADEEYAKEHNLWTSGGAVEADQSIKTLKQAASDLRKANKPLLGKPGVGPDTLGEALGPTGAITGMLGDTVNSFINPQAIDLRDRVGGVIQRSMKAILGSQYTQREGQGVLARTYNERLSPELNAQRVEKVITQMEEAAKAKSAKSAWFNEHGTMRGYTGPEPNFSGIGVFDDNAPSTGGSKPPLSSFNR